MKVQSIFYPDFISKTGDILLISSFITKMPKLLIFDAFTLLIREKNVAIYALLRCKMSQFTHFCGVKFLASKSGTWEFWTNFMSVDSIRVFS